MGAPVWLLLIEGAFAAEVEVGGGVDAIAGVAHPADGAWRATAGVRQLEGDLRVVQGAVTLELALDAAATVALPLPAVFALVPEQANVVAHTGKVWIGGGIAPAPWRLERVDGWDNALVSWSAADRSFLPGSLLGVTVGSGTPARGIAVAAGLDLGPGLDLLGDVGQALATAPLLVGVHGAWEERAVRFGGGVFVLPDTPAVAGQAAVDIDLEPVALSLQVVGGWNAPFGGHAQAALYPDALLSPAFRLEYFDGAAGATIGVALRPKPFFVTKAEIGWVGGVPSAWVEVAVFRPWPPRTKARPKGNGAKGSGAKPG